MMISDKHSYRIPNTQYHLLEYPSTQVKVKNPRTEHHALISPRCGANRYRMEQRRY
jgi:hypothetical protein